MSTFLMGRDVGLLVCMQCRATVRALPDSSPDDFANCPRCGGAVHDRKPHSIAITATLLVTAAVLYIPANVLPVMLMRTIFDEEDDTIMSGVLSLIQDGSWPLALVVFLASIVVPLLKLIAMGWLLFVVIRKSPGHVAHRSKLLRIVEFIGRWSMLDVFAISLLVALVQIRSLATIHVGMGALAFCSVVVLTMLAAQSFDERLLWDVEPHE